MQLIVCSSYTRVHRRERCRDYLELIVILAQRAKEIMISMEGGGTGFILYKDLVVKTPAEGISEALEPESLT